MPQFLLSFLKAHWQTAFIASAVLAIAAAFSLERLEIHRLSAKLSQCHGENAALEASNKALLLAVQDQNAAIFMLEEKARRKRIAAARAVASARAHAAIHTGRAERIKAQATTEDDCADMRRLLDEFVRQ